MRLSDCHNFHDFRALAQRRLPGPIFNYIDGAADDEKAHRQNTASFDRCDLVPNVLRGVEDVDICAAAPATNPATPRAAPSLPSRSLNSSAPENPTNTDFNS